MPFSKLNFKETAGLLNIHENQLKKLVNKRSIPFVIERGNVIFRKNDIKDWAVNVTFSQEFNKKKSKINELIDKSWLNNNNQKFLADLLAPDYANSILIQAKTKYSILKELVHLASTTSYVTHPDKLFKMLKEREDIQATGFTNGIAIPHPKIHHLDIITESFLIVGIVPGGIPFGAVDGELSDLFFLPLSATDEDHLFMISRLAKLLKKTTLADDLRSLESETQIFDCFKNNEIKAGFKNSKQ